jgi:hypothetical protein
LAGALDKTIFVNVSRLKLSAMRREGGEIFT